MKSQLLDGAKTPKQEKNIGSEETHGEHTGVLTDSSISKWEVKILLSKPIALPPLHPSRSTTQLKKKPSRKLKNSFTE